MTLETSVDLLDLSQEGWVVYLVNSVRRISEPYVCL